ncbi:TPA: YodL domain-containing protein [Clostridioides difficile]
MSYHAYDHDKLEAADTMRIERTIYFESENADISALTALTVEQLQAMREESAAAERAIFESLQQQAAAWEQQAGKTLELNKAIEYARTPAAQHTENKWQEEEYRHIRSNTVYQMSYRISENTRYDKAAQKSIPYSYTLSWSVLTNAPGANRQAHIAGQSKKVFADKEAMEKYLNGRIKAYDHLFTVVSPPIPKEYAEHFKVNGQLLPGYSIEGEEQKPPEHAADIPTPSNTEQRKEREQMSEQFSVLIDSRSRFETGVPGGAWLSMPATAEQLHEAMQSVGITADNPQDFFINGFANTESCPFDVPLEVIQRGSVDELNYLGKLLEMQRDEDKAKFTAAVTLGEYAGNLKDLINLAQNLDCYWIYPTVQSEEDYGYYLIDELDELELPAEAKKYFMYEDYGRDAAINDGGRFTEQGYIYNNKNTFTEWYDGRDVPEEYRIMSYPQQTRLAPEKVDMDAATVQTPTLAAEPTQPKPVIPINLTAEKPAEKLKEITDRLEQGITELFDSERYKEYLSVMSKFHNYSFNNTLLIAMQKPDASLIAGFNAWKNQFERNVKKGEKGIKIIAPSPFKVKKEMEKIDPKTQRPVIGRDGKPVTEEKEITIPAYKVVSVFDVSQTEGRELPDIAVDTLTGDVDKYKDFFAALEKTAPVPIGFEKIEGGAHGYYHLEDKRIALDEGMSELQTLKTAIHEIAHAKLHDIDLNAPKNEQQPRVDRRTREVEAESIAYTVCQHYGLDTSDYSFGYVAGWSSGRELAELKSSLETIRSTAAEIINSIDGHIAELQKEQQQTKEQGKPTVVGESVYNVRSNPYSDSRENSYILQEYVIAQENQPAKMGDALYIGTPEKCRELMAQLIAGELTQGQVKELYAKAQEQPQEQAAEPEQPAQEAEPGKDTFTIYQLKRGDETRDFRFEPYDRLTAAGLTVDPANYDLIYTAPLAPDMTLEQIYERFNIDHPADFKGHSLSVSDVVVLHQDGQDAAHYVDSIGYRQVPEFLNEPQKELIPDDFLTGEKIRTPRGTFSLTDMSHEQMKEAGYGFHHQSDDGKYHIMADGTRAFAIAAEQPEKVNPLKHVEDTVEQNDNNFDGLINNTPTVDELEAKAKAGEQISLTDLAAAIKADKERGKGKEEKPSIRAQLKADKERAKKKPTKSKSQDLERS